MRSLRLLALALALVSCSPRPCAEGDDAIVSGTWTVEGAAPTATSCADVGIDVVRLGVYCGGNPSYLDRLEAPCAAGQLDSRTPVLAAGTYDVAWEGFRDGVRVAQGARHTLVASAGGHATVPVVDFVSGYDPSGTDASLSAHWTIDGAAPTAESCLAAGVTRVRVAAFHGSRPYEIAPLTAACATGVIDTRPTLVLAAGDDVLQLQALGSHQEILFSGAMAMVHVPAGPGHVALYDDVPVDFAASAFDPRGTDTAVGFAWTLDRQSASIDVCDAVSGVTAELVLYASDDVARAHGARIARSSCRFGSFDSGAMRLLRAGTYLASVELQDDVGTVLSRADAGTIPLEAPSGGRLSVPTVDLPFPTTLTVTFDWGDPTTGSATTCAGALVSTMSYTLTETGSGAVVASATDAPCAQRLSFDAAHVTGLVAGTYDLAISGAGAGRTWHSRAGECTGMVVTQDGIAWDACLVATP